jgi:hypothetical protein
MSAERIRWANNRDGLMARVFVLAIRTKEEGAIRRLRRALKSMLRRDQLRCVSIEEKLEVNNRCRDGISVSVKRSKTMTTIELKNSTALATAGDGFDGYSDHVEGDESPQPRGIIRGLRLKFSNTAEYELPDGEVIGHGTKLIVTDIIRAVAKWGAGKNEPPETTVIPPGQPFPDVQAMNESVPKDQWRQGPAGLQGPYQTQQLVVMIEPQAMETYTFVTSAIGGFIAVRELVDKVKTMRRYRGPVSPIVTVGDRLMKTRFGERRRPHFEIVDWIRMGDGGEPQQAALPAPSPVIAAPVIEAAPSPDSAAPVIEAEPAAAAKPAKRSRVRPRSSSIVGSDLLVAPLTRNEEMNDEIPW